VNLKRVAIFKKKIINVNLVIAIDEIILLAYLKGEGG
jgi:hypothetical protein